MIRNLRVRSYPRKNRQVDYNADFLLYLLMNKVDSDHYPFYSDKAEYFKAWLANKRNNKWLGDNVTSEIGVRLANLSEEHEILQNKSFRAIKLMRELREKYGIENADDILKILPIMEALKSVPNGLQELRALFVRIKQLKIAFENMPYNLIDKLPRWMS